MTSISTELSDTLAKKASKKTSRALKILKKDTDLEESETATCTLFVCNAGLVTGCSSEDLLNVFSKFGAVKSVLLIPDKSYSFVVYFNLEDAVKALECVHGRVGFSDAGPLYVAHVPRPPSCPDPWREARLPPGLSLLQEFISREEEEELLALFHWDTGGQDGLLKHRKVKHFGFEFSYLTHNIDPSKPLLDAPIPAPCQRLLTRAVERGLVSELPDQLTVNRYLPGQGIPPHIDSHSCCSGSLLSLSLGSGVTMEFRNTTLGSNSQPTPVWLTPRSLLVLEGEARYVWSHGIVPRTGDPVPQNLQSEEGPGTGEGLTLVKRGLRVSLTFRKTIKGECQCPFPTYCDREDRDQDKGSTNLMEETASSLEKELVHQVYEEIASHFSDTRYKPWPRVIQFMESLEPGGVLLDLGCGNGKYLDQVPGSLKHQIGGDYSENLLNIVRGRGHQAVRCDLLSVPLRDSCVAAVLCIAALHHLATEERRLQALLQVFRVLEKGGRGLVYVWAKDQADSHYVKKKSTADTPETGSYGLCVHTPRTQFRQQDVLVPWKLKDTGQEFRRFYHVFEEGELEALVARAGLTVESSYWDQGNWCCVVVKD